MTRNDKQTLEALMNQWIKAWSPKDKAWSGAGLEQIFAEGENAIHVVDDFEGGAVVINSFEDYLATWVPVMAAFGYWEIKLVEPATIRVDGDLAVSTFQFVANGRLQDGSAISPAPSQHGTHIWERTPGGWRIVHEHLTNA